MAQEVIIRLRDDINGQEAAGTIEFGYDGVVYEIDLTEQNLAAFREVLDHHAQFARRISGRRPAKAKARPKTTQARVVQGVPDPAQEASERYQAKMARTQELAKVREWARERGYEIGEKGRVPKSIQSLYNEAHRSAG